jgi:hypothetical protein
MERAQLAPQGRELVSHARPRGAGCAVARA